MEEIIKALVLTAGMSGEGLVVGIDGHGLELLQAME
jgi:hypothetical protein